MPQSHATNTLDLSPAQIDRAARLKSSTPFFCKEVVKIRNKEGKLVPLILNKAQLYTHERLEQQRLATGRVRAIIGKGRKVGISTYVQARFYKRLANSPDPLGAYIITHESDATANLFRIAKTIYDNHPEDDGKPYEDKANAKELKFLDNGASYAVATAGTKETGRSGTFQLFHGSEAAFWPNAAETIAGAGNTVGDVAGTEIIIESTGNGVGGFFYSLWQQAIRGQGDYIAIFVPWMWDEDLQRECPDGWNPTEAWFEYAQLCRKLDPNFSWEQLYWAYMKNAEAAATVSEPLDKPCWKFRQEYPCTPEEMFQGGGNSFIPSIHIMRARDPKETIVGAGPVILGVDPARSVDRIGIIDRCGRRAGERICEAWDPPGSNLVVAQMVADAIDRIQPDSVNIDVGNGAAVYDILVEWQYKNLVPVAFGGAPITRGPTGNAMYENRRAELYDLARDWFNGDLPVAIPDRDDLHQDLAAPVWGPGATRYQPSTRKLIIESKESITARLGASPDLGDAFVLTFASPFARKAVSRQTTRAKSTSRRLSRNRTTGY